MIRGSTYPIEIISRNPNGWKEQWFDSGTGTLEISNGGRILQAFNLDIHRIPDTPGRYLVFYTTPMDLGSITLQAYGTVDSRLMRTELANIILQRG